MKLKLLCLLFLCTLACALEDENDNDQEERALVVDMRSFRRQNLNCHNKYRSIHQVDSLYYSQQLNTKAQNYAKQLAQADRMKRSSHGINIYYNRSNVDGHTACESWYAESQYYDYTKENPNNFNRVGQFTQMVWKDSTEFGIGVATSRSRRTYVVAYYSPPGNLPNQFRDNVFPSRFKF